MILALVIQKDDTILTIKLYLKITASKLATKSRNFKYKNGWQLVLTRKVYIKLTAVSKLPESYDY